MIYIFILGIFIFLLPLLIIIGLIVSYLTHQIFMEDDDDFE